MRENIISTFDEDIFDRKIIAENLTKIIESQEEPVVISLDSDWGTGKTTFLTMWKNFLDNDDLYKDKFKTLYFNAWENDYIKDPLLAIFSEMEKQIHEEDTKCEKNMNKMKAKAKPFGKAIVSTGVKLATAGLLNLDGVTLGDYNEAEIIKLSEKIGKISVNEIAADRTIRAKFKEEMAEYQKSIGKKIVFFIDELDRCRPTFAIELLEVIKHLFNMDNVVFIVAIDKEQLSHSVATIYGQNMDSSGYLRRFFDLEYKLPKVDVYKYIDNKNSIIFNGYVNTDMFQFFLREMFILEKFSLRDIDKAYYYIKLLLPLVKEFNANKQYENIYITIISYLYSVLITLKLKKSSTYKKIINGEYTVEEIVKEINEINLENQVESIGGWNKKPLSELLPQLMKVYLKVNLIYKANSNIYMLDPDKYVVGVKKDNGTYYYDLQFNILTLFREQDCNINNKLEFLESFNR